jgi:hypothetical protein
MTANVNEHSAMALNQLKQTGLLLLQGTEIPDLCRLITSQAIKGSWWAHPSSHKIFAVSEMLADHSDVTIAKLVSAKICFVHRDVWQQLVAVGEARDEWQVEGLSREAKLLLRELDRAGSLRADKLGPQFGNRPSSTALELELRLLIHSEQFHTETGHHTKLLETWDDWARRVKLRRRSIEPLRARDFFEQRIEELNQTHGGNGQLPWQAKKLLKVRGT